MTTPFVTQVRARRSTLRLGSDGDRRITVRVQMPEVWDAVRVETSPDESIAALKAAALEALYPGGDAPDAFVLKRNGFEVLDETVSVADAGATDGSIFLLTYRRRRPVR